MDRQLGLLGPNTLVGDHHLCSRKSLGPNGQPKVVMALVAYEEADGSGERGGECCNLVTNGWWLRWAVHYDQPRSAFHGDLGDGAGAGWSRIEVQVRYAIRARVRCGNPRERGVVKHHTWKMRHRLPMSTASRNPKTSENKNGSLNTPRAVQTAPSTTQ
jgi:hypothetical protein